MALQDLTPQLRTRLSRVERLVGWFVTLATVLLLAGLAYYIHQLAHNKGWFLQKIHYQTSLNNAAGLKPGDPVKLMGFEVGEITRIEANGPLDYYGVTVDFLIKEPYYGYLWSDSKVRVAAADLLGKRGLEVLKGRFGVPTIEEENHLPRWMLIRSRIEKLEIDATESHKSNEQIMVEVRAAVSTNKAPFYTNFTKASVYWLEPDESPALTERLEALVTTAEKALPNILALTNSIQAVLTNADHLAAHADDLLLTLRPIVTNLAVITTQLRDPHGSFGEWLLPTNLQTRLDTTLAAATATLGTTQTNIDVLSSNITVTLENLAGITSNLNAQVQANTNLLGSFAATMQHTDELVQGLKRHWLLRSAFKGTNQPPRTTR